MGKNLTELNETLSEAVQILKSEVNPEKIILFGSHAKGSAHEASDFDIMVVVKEKPQSRLKESARLRRLIAHLELHIDLLLVHEEKFSYWKDTINTVYFDAEEEGKVLYDKAA